MLSAAILYSGNSYIRISEMLGMINVAHFSQTVFYRIQKTLLFPTINTFYKRHRNEIVKQCAVREENNFIGDGRSDSPGYSAKYGTYSIMSSDLNKVVDFFVVHVSTAGNSSRREKKGLEVLLEKIQHIKITTLTTDRHVQIRAFLKNDHPNIIHQFDVWHFGKSIKKAL
jgi:MFS superfamily sulfate permease-like transporter